jgi:hypothetical protein
MNLFKVMILLAFSSVVFGLETDNFFGELNPPKDSSEIINKFVNEKIDNYLEENSSYLAGKICSDVRKKVLKSFRGIVVHAIEQYIDEEVTDEYIFPKRDLDYSEYFKKSIYFNKKIDLLKLKHLSRSINVNGIIIGSDKLSHFISTGIRYHYFYQRKINNGYTEKKAVERAINYGVFTEKFVLGKLTSKVLSHADLEANYQGFLFNKEFCQKENPYISFDGRWKRTRDFDIRSFVSPYWSEVFNPSYYTSWRWKMVKKVLEKKYCSPEESLKITSRLKSYSEIATKSESVIYITKLEERGKMPDRSSQVRSMSCFQY